MNRRNYLKGLGAAGVGAAALSAPVSAGEEEDVYGDNVYLVFGADTSETDLDSWLDEHLEGMSEAESSDGYDGVPYLQYQDVTQVNVTLRGLAVAIAINGGSASAFQQTFQQNENVQAGGHDDYDGYHDGKEREKTFNGADNVYILFANETDGHAFNGWAVDSQTYEPDYERDTGVDQAQEVDQLNFSLQGAAISLAEGGSDAQAYQWSYQENNNLQAANVFGHGESNCNSDGGSGRQYQDVDQANVALQGLAIAIAVGRHSEATAAQATCQFNRNAQLQGDGPIFDPMDVEEFAASANMTGDYSEMEWEDGEHTTHGKHENGYYQGNHRGHSDGIEQFQDVLQANVNVQLLALAIATDCGEARATQASYQGNFNAQVLESDGNDLDSLETGHGGFLAVEEGEMMKDGRWGAAYENGRNDSVEQITQVQFVQQLNLNAQLLAIAVAEDDSATAEQCSFQLNKNLQYLDVDGDHGKGKKKKKGKKGKKGKNHEKDENHDDVPIGCETE
jgi:hypothetical protein